MSNKSKIFKLKNDKYKQARGGQSRLLAIACANCNQHLCNYQKDGPGLLKRIYIDRIVQPTFQQQGSSSSGKIPTFICPNCKQVIGNPIVYEKEKRLAYHLFIGTFTKKIVKSV